MELRDLRYFVMVAAELHFARAAQRLFISQPALSQQIRSLEGELGFKLLERNSRGVKLTAEGRAFLTQAEAVVQAADHAAEVARALAEGATGNLRLSHLRTMPRGLPERVVSEYQRRYPGVEINPDSGSIEQNLERVRGGQLDLAFVLGPLAEIARAWFCARGQRTHCCGSAECSSIEPPTANPPRGPEARTLVWYPRHTSAGFYDSGLA